MAHALLQLVAAASVVVVTWANPLCPRDFSFLAYEGEKAVAVPSSFGDVYVSFGRDGFYSISQVSVLKDEAVGFKCDKKNFGLVENVLTEDDAFAISNQGWGVRKFAPRKAKKDEKLKNICCVRKMVDMSAGGLLLPSAFLKPITTSTFSAPRRDTPGGLAWLSYAFTHVLIGRNLDQLRHHELVYLPSAYFRPGVSSPNNQQLSENAVKKVLSQTIFSSPKILQIKPTQKWFQSNFHKNIVEDWKPLQHMEIKHTLPFTSVSNDIEKWLLTGNVPDQLTPCFPTPYRCDTGNAQSLTAFFFRTKELGRESGEIYLSSPLLFIKLAYSATGVFDVSTLSALPIEAYGQILYEVYYAPIEKFYGLFGQKLPDTGAMSAILEWRLASMCASCPGNSVKITISEKQAKVQKTRVQHALNINAKASLGILDTKVALGAGYTASFFNELDESLTTGTTVSFSAQCNGFYLYHLSARLGSKLTGWLDVGTQHFYCSDRPVAPQCVPAISSNYKAPAVGANVCSGYDTNKDFGMGNDQGWDKDFHFRPGHDAGPAKINVVQMAQQKVLDPQPKLDWAYPKFKTKAQAKAAQAQAQVAPIPDGAHAEFDDSYLYGEQYGEGDDFYDASLIRKLRRQAKQRRH